MVSHPILPEKKSQKARKLGELKKRHPAARILKSPVLMEHASKHHPLTYKAIPREEPTRGREPGRHRRTATSQKGRPVDTRAWRGGEADLTATFLRAWKEGRLWPQPSDLRSPHIQSPLDRLILILLDVSDSMTEAVQWMRAWIAGTMARARRHRDSIAIITVQGKGAHLLCFPTTNPHFLLHKLATIRIAGATPLDKGLEAARRSLLQWRERYPCVDLYLVTDGRSTNPLGGRSVKRNIKVLRRLSERIVVINPVPQAQPFAEELASALGASLYGPPQGMQTDLQEGPDAAAVPRKGEQNADAGIK